MALMLDVKPGEALVFDGGRVRIEFERKTGARSRVKIDADQSVSIEQIKAPVDGGQAVNGLKRIK